MSPDAKAACNAAITPVSKIASNPSMLGSIKVLFWSRAQMAVATGSWDFKLAAHRGQQHARDQKGERGFLQLLDDGGGDAIPA